MKKKILQHVKKSILFTCFLFLITFMACQNDESSVSQPISGRWKLNDKMQVNSGSGIPRTERDSDVLISTLNFDKHGTFKSVLENGATMNGKWTINGENIVLTFDGNKTLNLRVGNINDQSMELEQLYPSENNYSSGVIYYSFKKM